MMVWAETIGIWSLGIGMLSIEWIGIIIPEQQQLYGVDTRCECTIIDPNVYTTILRICHLLTARIITLHIFSGSLPPIVIARRPLNIHAPQKCAFLCPLLDFI